MLEMVWNVEWEDLLVTLLLGSDGHRPHLLPGVAGAHDSSKALLSATLTNDVR